MNWLDIILVIPIVWLGFKGFKKGIIIEVFSLLALLAGIYGGIHLSEFTTEFLTDDMKIQSEYMPIIAFGVTFILIVVLVYYVGKLLDKVIKMIALNFVNKAFGACFGMVKAILLLSLFLILIESVNRKANFIPRDLKHGSLLYEPILMATSAIFPVIKNGKIFDEIEDWWEDQDLIQEGILNQ